jgi:alanyl-tRNA synthetase
MAARAPVVDGVVRIVERADGWDILGMKTIAMRIAERPGHVAVLIGSTPPGSVVVARASDVGGFDAGALVKVIGARFGGKGGGRPEFAQGGGLNALPDEILRFAAEALDQQLRR